MHARAATITAWNGHAVEEVATFSPSANAFIWHSGYTRQSYVEDYALRPPIAIRMRDGTVKIVRPPSGRTWKAEDWGDSRDEP